MFDLSLIRHGFDIPSFQVLEELKATDHVFAADYDLEQKRKLTELQLKEHILQQQRAMLEATTAATAASMEVMNWLSLWIWRIPGGLVTSPCSLLCTGPGQGHRARRHQCGRGGGTDVSPHGRRCWGAARFR